MSLVPIVTNNINGLNSITTIFQELFHKPQIYRFGLPVLELYLRSVHWSKDQTIAVDCKVFLFNLQLQDDFSFEESQNAMFFGDYFQSFETFIDNDALESDVRVDFAVDDCDVSPVKI